MDIYAFEVPTLKTRSICANPNFAEMDFLHFHIKFQASKLLRSARACRSKDKLFIFPFDPSNTINGDGRSLEIASINRP